MLDHHEILVEVDESGRDFTAIVESAPSTFPVRYVVTEDRRLALAIVEEEAAPLHRSVLSSGI